MYGNIDAVRAAGRRASVYAEQLHHEADLTAQLADVGWVSTGADRWRAELEGTVGRLRDDAAQVEELADALFAHADGAEATLQAITSAMAAFERRVRDARDTLASAAEGVADTAVSGARAVVDAASRAPSPLSLDWLSFR